MKLFDVPKNPTMPRINSAYYNTVKLKAAIDTVSRILGDSIQVIDSLYQNQPETPSIIRHTVNVIAFEMERLQSFHDTLTDVNNFYSNLEIRLKEVHNERKQ